MHVQFTGMPEPRVNPPALRLVNAHGGGDATVYLQDNAGQADMPAGRRAAEHAARRIESENRAAAELSASDARWAFAVRVSQAIEGGRAGVLPPEKRHRLIASAVHMGLRPFDANLIIAVVQDGARGGPQDGSGSLGPDVADRLRLIRPAPSRQIGTGQLVLIALATVVTAAAILAWLVAWVLGA